MNLARLVDYLVCPICKEDIKEINGNSLFCSKCGKTYSINKRGVPNLLFFKESDLADPEKRPQLNHVPDFLKQTSRRKSEVEKLYVKMIRNAWKQFILDYYSKTITRKINILDIGMGLWHRDGFKEEVIELEGIWGNYIACDPAEMLDIDLRNSPNFGIVKAFGEYCPIKSSFADVCVILSTLDHVFNPKMVISEAHRCLKPNGVIIISLNNDTSWFKTLLWWEAEKRRKMHANEHSYNFSSKTVKNMLSSQGFFKIVNKDILYLKLPYHLENFMESLFKEKTYNVLQAIDNVSSTLIKERGGHFVIVATKGKNSR